MSRYRVVFLGTPVFAVPSLDALARAEEVTLVVTNPDRPAGRGRELTPPPVKNEAQRLGIPVVQPEKAKHPESVARIAAERPDLIVVAAYGQILPPSILDIPRHGCINVHASLLPRYRGAAPINWAIVRGETVTGITIMKMDPGMDTGPILHMREEPIGEEDTAETMLPRLAALGAEVLTEALEKHHAGTLTETPQDGERATYAPMLKKEHGRIEWGRPAREVRNLVRGMTPWPSAYTDHAGKTLKVLAASVREGNGEPGEILSVDRDGLVVACGEGSVLLTKVQPEGGRAMSSHEYAQGRRVRKGDRLSS
jgi:methionyl-tRNA formyltransferase